MKIKLAKKPFRLSLGDRGEMVAAGYLAEKGYAVLDQKVRAPFGELDLIVQKKDTIVFVEVKTRSSINLGLPEEAVDLEKQKQMTRLAQWYLQKNFPKGARARFDVIAILYDGFSEPQIRHIKNAFEAVS